MNHAAERAAQPAGELYLPTDVSPEQLFQAIGRLRREAQDEIDRLLAFLDATDGDADAEPSLGAVTQNENYTQANWAQGNTDEREGDDLADDREGDELQHGGEAVSEDHEPSLGWPECQAGLGGNYYGQPDLEEDDGARSPQDRSQLDRPALTVEITHRRFLRGLLPEHRELLFPRLSAFAGVTLV